MTRNKHSGKVLEGRYEILSLLDEGGMGAVYLGRHIKLGRSVAVKFLHGELASNKEVVTRFYREAKAASAISHPNIIDVYDVGVSDWGEPYLVMEYLSGENLDSLLERKGPVSLSAACGIMEPALRALHAAHDQGLVHRDIKPENIFLMRQEGAPPIVKLIDFGISKFLQTDQTKLTRTGSLLGTPSYMSPEQARGRGNFDHRSDIYSMGVVLHFMLCGSLPFVGESYNDLIVNILTEPVKKPTDTYPNFPADAEPIVIRLLEKDPERRFGMCMQLLEALASLDAFAGRQEALGALTADMPEERFATGDLGETNEFFDETAVTVYADMVENGVETVPDGLLEDGVKKPSVPAKPSSSPAPEGRKKLSRVLLFWVAFAFVGIGLGLYGIGLIPGLGLNRSDSADTESVSPPVLPIKPREVKVEPPVVVPLTNGEKTPRPTPEVSEDKTDGTDASVALETEDIPTDGRELEPASEIAPGDTSSKESPSAPAEGAESGAATRSDSGKSPRERPKDVSNKKGGEALVNSVAPSEETAVVRPAPVDSLTPLTPVAINKLLEARHGKVMTCYDLARAKIPELAGILELKVGMAGNTVAVTVTGGNISGFLSKCIIQVIRSTTVPPNDGTLVEILKEYEFR